MPKSQCHFRGRIAFRPLLHFCRAMSSKKQVATPFPHRGAQSENHFRKGRKARQVARVQYRLQMLREKGGKWRQILLLRHIEYPTQRIASAFLLKNKDGKETAEVIHRILTDEKLKNNILHNQKVRLKDFQHDEVEKQFIKYLKNFIRK